MQTYLMYLSVGCNVVMLASLLSMRSQIKSLQDRLDLALEIMEMQSEKGVGDE
jgi:hypothetical protein